LSCVDAQVYQLMKEQMGLERNLADLHPEMELDASDLEEEKADSDAEGAPGSAAPDFGASFEDVKDEL
jgi:hypothetical protein